MANLEMLILPLKFIDLRFTIVLSFILINVFSKKFRIFFREDLYHRLAVILIDVPSLSNRRDDIPDLIRFFTQQIADEQGTAIKIFSPQAIKLLQEYDWTGNIRELRNVVERLIILGDKEVSENDVKLFASK